jgi:hypothetical protein
VTNRQFSIRKIFDSPGLMLVFIGIILALGIHGFLLINQHSYQGTYDAYVHIFFASKVKNHFGMTWVYNWFEGFDLVSYPPLVPQLIAAFSRWMPLERAYVAVQLLAITLMVTGSYRFCRLWLAPLPSGYGAICAALMTSMAQQIHQFGQLPTCLATALVLHAMYYFSRWCLTGGIGSLVAGLLYTVITSLAHHLTFFLFFPVAFGIVSLTLSMGVNRHDRQHQALIFRRISFFFLLAVISAGLVLHPFFEFVLQKMPYQAEIPHATRANYFADIASMLNFFIAPLASCFLGILLLPKIFRDHFLLRPLAIGILLFCLLGLGGTTPVPAFIFGKFWKIFTFDRFAAWAAVLLLPMIGYLFSLIQKPILRMILIALQASLLIAYFAVLRGVKFQPDPVDLHPVANFLSQPDKKTFRYVTLGLGSQMAKLSYMTPAPSVDGLYFTARTTKVLRNSGIEAIDSAKYFGEQGQKVLEAYLEHPEDYNLKYAVVNDEFYVEVLKKHNWRLLQGNFGNIKIWESRKTIRALPKSYFKQRSSLGSLSQFFWSCGIPVLLIAFFVDARIWLRAFSHDEVNETRVN